MWVGSQNNSSTTLVLKTATHEIPLPPLLDSDGERLEGLRTKILIEGLLVWELKGGNGSGFGRNIRRVENRCETELGVIQCPACCLTGRPEVQACRKWAILTPLN